MKMHKVLYLFVWVSVVLAACKGAQQTSVISFNHPEIVYEGRITRTDTATEMYWSGTSVTLSFEGTEISAVLGDERGDNYYNILVDGELHQMLHTSAGKHEYLLADSLEKGNHTVTLFKRTEYDRGLAWFYGFRLANRGKVIPTLARKTRKIEYYGDSITAGYSTNDYEGDRSDSIYTNYYESYANLIAQHFNAQQHCICKSGIGITISWFDYEMADIWNLTNPFDPESTWDFNQYIPDLVIVNLLQNDSWLVNRPDMPSFKENFGDTPPSPQQIISAYAEFLEGIRSKYPETPIIATLGNMDITQEGSSWPGYVQEAVALLNDEKIYTVFTPFKNTPGHPKVEEQRLIAENLIAFIEKNLGW